MRPELKEIADGIVAAVKDHVAKATDDQLEVVAGLEARVVNKMAEQFFGYSAEELLNLPLTKVLLLLNIENIPRLHKSFREALNEQHITEEIHFVSKEGDSVICKVYASSIRSGVRKGLEPRK